MNDEERGYLYQKYEPTPDKPCEIQGKNLLEDGELIIRQVPIKYVDDYVKLQNNWNELKEYAKENLYFYSGLQGEDREEDTSIKDILNKMQELEQGKDE